MSTPLAVSCPHCGAGLKMKSNSFVGKKVPCPKCKQPFLVEQPPEDEFLSQEDDFGAMADEEEEAEAPRSKGKSKGDPKSAKGKGKKKSKSGGGFAPIAMIAGGVVLGIGLLGGIVYGAMALFSGGGSSSWVKWLPDSTETVVQVRVADAMNAPIFKPLVDHPTLSKLLNQPPAAGQAGGNPTSAFMQGLGIQSKDIDTLTIGYPNLSAGQSLGGGQVPQKFVAVVRLKTALDESKLAQAPATVMAKEDYNGKAVYALAGSTPKVLVHSVNSTTYLIGSDVELKAAIDSKGAAPADKRFAYVNSKSHIVIAAAPKDPAAFKSATSSGFQASSGLGQPSDGTEGFALTIELGSDAKLVATTYGSEAGATANAEEFKKALAELKSQMQAQKSQSMGFNPFVSQDSIKKLVGHVETMLNGAQVASSGKTATLSMTLPGQIVNDGLAMAAPLMPMLEAMVAEQQKAAAAAAAASQKSTLGNSPMDMMAYPQQVMHAGESSKTKINNLNDQHQADLAAQMQEGGAANAHGAPSAAPAATPSLTDPAQAMHAAHAAAPAANATPDANADPSKMMHAAAANGGGNAAPAAAPNADPAKMMHALQPNAGGNAAPAADPNADPAKMMHAAGNAGGNAAAGNGQNSEKPATKSRSRRRTTPAPAK